MRSLILSVRKRILESYEHCKFNLTFTIKVNQAKSEAISAKVRLFLAGAASGWPGMKTASL